MPHSLFQLAHKVSKKGHLEILKNFYNSFGFNNQSTSRNIKPIKSIHIGFLFIYKIPPNPV
jgi:hypothetical protein